MSTHIKSELSSLNQLFLALLLSACIAIYFVKSFDAFPRLPYLGITIGLAFMVACWEKKRQSWSIFICTLILYGIVWTIVFSWTAFF